MSYNKSNPLTAKIAKILRKGRKEVKRNGLLCVLCVFSHRIRQLAEEVGFAYFAVRINYLIAIFT
jgi:anti-anti-sigma regulatory factor